MFYCLWQLFGTFCGLGLHNVMMYEKISVASARNKVAFDILSYHASSSQDEASRLMVSVCVCEWQWYSGRVIRTFWTHGGGSIGCNYTHTVKNFLITTDSCNNNSPFSNYKFLNLLIITFASSNLMIILSLRITLCWHQYVYSSTVGWSRPSRSMPM